MQRTAAISKVAIALVAVGIGVAGCGSSSSSSKNASGTSAASNTSAATTSAKPQSKVAPRTARGPNPSIASYIQQNHITETPVHKGDPGAPTINFPIPDGWADAGPDTPATAYWAIVDTGPEAAKYTPSIVATLSKLDGNVDPQKLIDLAAGERKTCPDSRQWATAPRQPCQFSRIPTGRHLDARRPDEGDRDKDRRHQRERWHLSAGAQRRLPPRRDRPGATRNHHHRREDDDRGGYFAPADRRRRLWKGSPILRRASASTT